MLPVLLAKLAGDGQRRGTLVAEETSFLPLPDTSADDISALRATLAAAELARQEAEARATSAEAIVAHLKRLIAKLKHDRFGASSERGRTLIDQLELERGELVAAASEAAATAENAAGKDKPSSGTSPRRQPAPVPCRRTCRANACMSPLRIAQLEPCLRSNRTNRRPL